jgi:hypothetical protein
MKALRSVETVAAPKAGRKLAFCSHCGESRETDEVQQRVCDSCGMGLMLEAPEELAPSRDDLFIVIEATLSVGAVSRSAERFLAVHEADAVNRPIDELLAPANAESDDGPGLASAIMWAARGDGEVREMQVRPANTFGVRCRARIGPCGPPDAALLVLSET